MNAFFTRILLLCTISSVISSCGGDDDPGPVSALPTFLNVGSTYTIDYDDGLFNAGVIEMVVDTQVAPDTFLVRYYSETVSVGGTQYWVLKDNNLYTSIRLRDPSTYVLECRFGQPVGTSWNVVKAGQTYKYTIVELNTPITTGDNVVNDAVKIRVKAPNGAEIFQYISPTVGLLGNGSVGESVLYTVQHYHIGTPATTTNHVPPISFGTFPFLSVGKYWTYNEESIFGGEVEVKLTVDSKTAQNVYKIKIVYNGTTSYAYWYEDHGVLMAYDEGETPLNADPLYVRQSIAEEEYGWASVTSNGTIFIYEIISANTTMDTFFGELSCEEIYVTDGLFGSQTNYWNENKGNVYVDGFVAREVIASNARKETRGIPFMFPVAF